MVKKGLLHTSFALMAILLSHSLVNIYINEWILKVLPFVDKKMFLFFQICSTILIYYMFETVYYSVHRKGIYISKHVIRVILWMYLLFMFYVLFYGRENVTNSGTMNLEFFHTIRSYLRAYEIGNAHFLYLFTNLAGNVLLFIPIGFILYFWFSNRLRTRILFGIAVIIFLGVELSQYYFKIGSFDVDDIFLNSIGGFIGLIVAKIIK